MYKYNGEDYQTLINQNTLVLIDFFAEWCGPCLKLMPIIKKVSEIKKNIYFCKINVDDYNFLLPKYKVVSLPTLIFYQNGKEIKRKNGFCYESELLNFLDI